MLAVSYGKGCSEVNLASDPAIDDAQAGFSPLLQAPARLQIAALLSHAQDAEFQRLKDVTGCSDSVVSKHLSALADAGLIRMRKAAINGRSRTWVKLTQQGRAVYLAHVAALQNIISGEHFGDVI